MTPHLWFVTVAWMLAGIVFAALAVAAALRHRAAEARLKVLDPRAGRDAA